MTLTYTCDRRLTPEAYVDLLKRSTLGGRRPLADAARMAAMVENADVMATAWDGDRLVGAARSVTDFAYCCYLSDLSVDEAYQRRGIGLELIRLTQARLHPACKIILLAAPGAETYYPKIGFQAHPSAWLVPASPVLPGSVAPS
jgi:GNAT superfamily N-acetyltransferase